MFALTSPAGIPATAAVKLLLPTILDRVLESGPTLSLASPSIEEPRLNVEKAAAELKA
jgi:hypothetical protein